MRILIPEMNTINKMYLYLTATTARSHRATSDISVRTAFDDVRDWFLIFFHHCMCGSARACVCFLCQKRCDLKTSFKTSVFQRRTWSREILIPSTSWTAPSKSNFGFSFLLSKVQSTPPLISEKSNGVQSSKLQYCGLSSICFNGQRLYSCCELKQRELVEKRCVTDVGNYYRKLIDIFDSLAS